MKVGDLVQKKPIAQLWLQLENIELDEEEKEIGIVILAKPDAMNYMEIPCEFYIKWPTGRITCEFAKDLAIISEA